MFRKNTIEDQSSKQHTPLFENAPVHERSEPLVAFNENNNILCSQSSILLRNNNEDNDYNLNGYTEDEQPISYQSNTSLEDINEEYYFNNNDILSDLHFWSIENNIKNKSVNKLLTILRKHFQKIQGHLRKLQRALKLEM